MNPNAQPDYIALAMVTVMAVIVVVMVIRKWLSNRAAKVTTPQPTPASPNVISTEKAPGTGGQIKLNNVHPRTAAMLMAIVADQTGKPLNELHFISIQEVKE